VAYWLLFGIVVGALASVVGPERRTIRRSLLTSALGALGALLGGYGGRALGLYAAAWSPPAAAMAVLGSLALVVAYYVLFATRRVY
jgi:uncharacterized membrane protein YeaQ/YmgE (transglycosylase-associated protein family)